MLVSTPPAAGKVRKSLSADALYGLVRNAFGRLPDHRHEKAAIRSDVVVEGPVDSTVAVVSLEELLRIAGAELSQP